MRGWQGPTREPNCKVPPTLTIAIRTPNEENTQCSARGQLRLHGLPRFQAAFRVRQSRGEKAGLVQRVRANSHWRPRTREQKQGDRQVIRMAREGAREGSVVGL